MAIDSSLTNNIEQSYVLGSGGNAGDIGSVREFINTSDSFDEWRKFTNRIAQDLETLMDQVDSMNALGAPASSPTFTGAPVLNQFSLDSNVFSSVRTHSELIRSTANASDNSLVTEKAISAMRDTLNTAIATKATISNASFTGPALFEDGILTVRHSTSDTELRINAQGNNKAILKFGGPDIVTDTSLDVESSVTFDFNDGISPTTTGLEFLAQVPADSGTFSLHNQYGFETTISNGNSATYTINVTAITGTIGFYINILSTGGAYEDTILPAAIGNGDGVISSTGSYSFSTDAFTDGNRKLHFILAVGDGESVTIDSFEATLTGDSGQTDSRIEVDGPGNISFHSTSLDFTSAGTVTGISKAEVGLGNVTNESKATMFTSPTFTGTARYTGTIAAGDDSTKIATTAWAQDLIAAKITAEFDSSNGNARLDNIDNTSDANKPISTLTQAALDLKAPKASPTFTGNVTAATAPTATSHLTNKTYVDTQVATKDNYGSWSVKAENGTAIAINSGNTIDFQVTGSESDAINFTRSTRRIGLNLNLANLDATKDGIIPNTVLPTGANGIDTTYIKPSALQVQSEGFTNSDDILMTAAAINDRITARISGAISGDITGTFVDSASTTTSGLDVSVTDGALLINLDMNELTKNTTSDTADYFIIGHRTSGEVVSGAPQRMKFSDVHIDDLDHVNRITLGELSGVADTLTATDNNALMYDSSTSLWTSQSLNNVITLANVKNVNITSISNKDLLWYNSSTSKWVNESVGDVIDKDNHSKNLDDIANDVADYTTPANGYVLKWNGSKWSPAADNNTTYSAGVGLDLNGTTFKLENEGNLVSGNLLKWDGNSLADTEIDVTSIGLNIGDRRLFIQDSGTSGDRILITAYEDASGSGDLPVAKADVFSSTNTRKSGISFGDKYLSSDPTKVNDPGFIVHESGTTSTDGNNSVIHLSPGDDNNNSTDYVVIKGFNKAENTGLRLGTAGDIRYVNDIYQRARNGTLASKWTNAGLHIARSNNSSGTSRRGGRIYLQKGNHDDGYTTEAWSITPSSGLGSGRDDLIIVEDSSGGGAVTALRIREDDHVVMAPNAAAADITGNKDLVTLEKLESYTDGRIALKLFGPRPIFTLTHFFESRTRYGEDGDYYYQNDAYYQIAFHDMAASGFQKHEIANKYFIKIDIMTKENSRYNNAAGGTGNDSTPSKSALFATSGNSISTRTLHSGGNWMGDREAASQVRFNVVITDLVTNRMYEVLLPTFKHVASNTNGARMGVKLKHNGNLTSTQFDPSNGTGSNPGSVNSTLNASTTTQHYYGGYMSGSYINL